MCRRWIRDGHKITVLTTPYDKSDIRAVKFVERQEFDGIEVIVVNVMQSNKRPVMSRIFGFLAFSIVACYYSLRLNYDVVVASSGPITVGIPALLARWLQRKKMVFEVRDLWPRGAVELNIIKSRFVSRSSYWFEALCYKSSSLIVACSDGMADDIKKRFPQLNVVVVPNACDSLFTSPTAMVVAETLLGKQIIVYAGSMGIMDDCTQIIDAARLIQASHPKVTIVMIGDGAERAGLELTVRRDNLSNIVFLGLIPKDEVARWLKIATASIVVFKNVPVLNTSSPNKLFDSLAAGVPVIQTTQGWIKDLVRKYEVGITVDPNNAREMAAAIIALCRDVEQRNRFAENARLVAMTLFDREKLSRYMIESIANAIGK